jgi:hypothetical protein
MKKEYMLKEILITKRVEMKNYLSYYQHYSNSHQHWKFKMLRSFHGWAGEGRFWALNNLIASTDNCILDIGRKAVKVSVADELGMSVDEFMKFLEFLSQECELITLIDNKISTEIVRENLHEVMKQRRRAASNKNKHLEKSLTKKVGSYPKLLESLD